MKKLAPVTAVLVAFAIIFSGTMYVVGQQIVRQGANDPQIQFAEDAAARLSRSEPVDTQAFGKTDIASSLAPFMIIYDADGVVLQSSGMLHGKTPSLPKGVLDYTKAHHEDRFTWQPESGVRIAAVTVYASGGHTGFVLAGRNLGEVERRENQVMLEAGAALLASLLVIGAFVMLPRKHTHHE